MYRITKILLIIILAVILIFSLWYFNIRVFLADYYYQRILLTNEWPEILRLYQKVFYFQPQEPFYYQKFAIDLKWGLKFYNGKKSKSQILSLAIDQISRIKKNNRTFSAKIYLARLAGLKANITQSQKDFLMAEQAIKKASQMSPQMAKVYTEWCQIKIYEKKWNQAREMCKKAFYLLPSLDSPQMNQQHKNLVIAEMSGIYEKLGKIYLALKNYKKAEMMYLQVLKFYPLTRPDIWKKLGDIYYLQNDLNTAIERNFHGYILRPNDPFWSLTLSLLYKEKGDMEKALTWAKNALKLSPKDKR